MFVLSVFTLFVSVAHATTILPGPETPLQQILNDITVATSSNPSGNSSVDVHTDQIAEGTDAYWAIGGSGGSLATFVIEITANNKTNSFGIYDMANPNSKVQLFGSSSTDPMAPGTQAIVSILANGDVRLNLGLTPVATFAGNAFGFYMNTGSVTYYSDSSLNNDGGFDHMVAYEGKGDKIQIGGFAPGDWLKNEFLLAFEDGPNGGDKDYNDMVVMVESVSTVVPEPGTVLLLGSGLIGLAFLSRRKK